MASRKRADESSMWEHMEKKENTSNTILLQHIDEWWQKTSAVGNLLT